MGNFNNGNYGRAKQEEGKGTYEGLRRSQHMMLFRFITFLLVVCIIAFLAIAIQGKVEGRTIKGQATHDYEYLKGGKIGRFSTCDLNHDCKHKGQVDGSRSNENK